MAFTDKQAAFKYVNEYQKDRYDRITVMAKKGKKVEYQTAAKLKGMSLSEFIQDCVEKGLARMKE